LHFQTSALYEEEEQITHHTFKFGPNDLVNKEEYTSVCSWLVCHQDDQSHV
ncbi:hypothetical protein BDR06DRAFT_965617, partial [Suillus hirtellus]